MEKIITFAVPCYNSEGYMRKCIDSILTAESEDVEIVIIDDGSTDGTGAIADEYAARYPGICVAHHQENGGHGEGVNQGLRMARGKYYKVVDSDDWLDTAALYKLLRAIRATIKKGVAPDLIVTNYVYEHDDGPSHIVRYGNVFPVGRVCGWDSVRRMKTTQYFMMHSLTYRAEALRGSGLVMPKHTFYVDNLYVYQPMLSVHSILYLDADLYRYYIGRPDQSVNEENLLKRLDQQIAVGNMMIDAVDLSAVRETSRPQYNVLCHHLAMILMICSVMCCLKNTPESLAMRRDLWDHLKSRDLRIYRKMRYATPPSAATMLPTALGRRIAVFGYRTADRLMGLNK